MTADIGDRIELNEDERTYLFPGGDTITLSEPRELVVRPSGTHRIRTSNGKLVIVNAGWLAIQITDQSEDWTA